MGWILLYTIWNANFVYGETPAFFASTLVILAIPVIRAFVNKRNDLWMSARAYTLGLHLLIRANYDIFTPLMDSSEWFNPLIHQKWALANAILALFYLLYTLYKHSRGSRVTVFGFLNAKTFSNSSKR